MRDMRQIFKFAVDVDSRTLRNIHLRELKLSVDSSKLL